MEKKLKIKISWQINPEDPTIPIKELLKTSWREIDNGLCNHEFYGVTTHQIGNTTKSGFWSINDAADHHAGFILEGEASFQFDSPDGKPIPKRHQDKLEEQAYGAMFERLRWEVEQGNLTTWIKRGRQTIQYNGNWKFNRI